MLDKEKSWYKRWWAITLFILAGLYFLSLATNNKETINFKSTAPIQDPIISQAEPYLDKVVSEDIELRRFASSIVANCPSGDKECQLNEIYNYVTRNFNYYSDPRTEEFIQSPSETLAVKGGDCEDLTILMNSLLENLGFKTYIVLTDNHAYSLACGIETEKLWPYIESDLIKETSTELGNNGDYSTKVESGQLFIVRKVKETISLSPGHVAYYGGNGAKITEPFRYENIKYYISSNEPLDLYLVPSGEEQKNIANNKKFVHYPSCQKKDIYETSGSCDILKDNGGIILVNKNGRNAKVEIELNFYYAYDTESILEDKKITYYTIEGEKCVVLESTAGKFGFPGYDSTTGKKYAIDPVTKEYYTLNYG